MKRNLGIALLATLALIVSSCGRAQPVDQTAQAKTSTGPASKTKENAVSVRIVPEFTFSMDQLGAIISDLPADIQSTILQRPADFLDLLAKVLDEPADYFVLVDKKHALQADYVPPELVLLKDYGVSVARPSLQLRKSIMPEVVAMSKAAQADGVVLLFSSTYRSYATQKFVYDREVADYGKAVADRESAVPGESQHQLGTAIDFGSITDAFAKTDAARWLEAHAWQFGFSLSYPKEYEWLTGYRYEVWHYRYITPPGVLLQREFFDDVQQYLLVFLHDHRRQLVESRLAPAS